MLLLRVPVGHIPPDTAQWFKDVGFMRFIISSPYIFTFYFQVICSSMLKVQAFSIIHTDVLRALSCQFITAVPCIHSELYITNQPGQKIIPAFFLLILSPALQALSAMTRYSGLKYSFLLQVFLFPFPVPPSLPREHHMFSTQYEHKISTSSSLPHSYKIHTVKTTDRM